MDGRRGAIARVGAAVLLLGAAACDDTTGFTEPVASIDVAPAAGLHSGILVVGDTVTLMATPRSAAGLPHFGRPVVWTSSDTAVARVSAAGVVTARASGSVQIRAGAEGRMGQMGLGVTTTPAGIVASGTVSPTANVIAVGGTREYTARAFDANGTELMGLAVLWTALPAGVVSVSAQGVVTAVGPGYGEVRATVAGVSFTSAVTIVTP
jgi:lactocepin